MSFQLERLPTFHGKHNKVKAAVLMLLYLRRNRPKDQALSAWQISEVTGASYGYLLRKLPLLAHWQYIKQHTVVIGQREYKRYRIADRGLKFLTYKTPREVKDEVYADMLQRSKNDAGKLAGYYK